MASFLFVYYILSILSIHNAQYVNTTCSDAPLNTYSYCNPNLPINDRVEDLLSRLTLWEKVYLQNSDQGGVPRLGVPTLGHSECNRGTGVSPDNLPNCAQNVSTSDFPLTCFPQAINLAGAFSRDLVGKMARAISDEVRAKQNLALKYGCNSDNGFGIACWAPMINICRDPRWGRCQEGYGEDPLLMSELVSSYIPNLQNDPNVRDYYQALTTCKHFDGFSGPGNMGGSDSIINYRDWKSTYLPAFKACVDAGTSSFMCSYNEINGVPSCANRELLTEILREEWNFTGYVTSDCGAVPQIYKGRGSARNYVEAAEHAIKAGCDWIGSCSGPNPDNLFLDLYYGISNGTMPIKYLDRALRRVLPFWFKLGLIDYPNKSPWSSLDLFVEYTKHKQLAFEIAVKSMILFKNEHHFLPLAFDQMQKNIKIAVIGPCANNSVCYSGDYAAVPLSFVSPLDALQNNYGNNLVIEYVAGCEDPSCRKHDDWSKVKNVVSKSDIVIFVGGISYEQEAEGTDREHIELPKEQSELFKVVYNASLSDSNAMIPIVSVLCYGAPVIDHFLVKHSQSIIGAGYGGEMIGDAVISLMNGSYVPSGRSSVTWYSSTEQLPNMTNYDMMAAPGRTYRYFEEEPLFPFGFGLSYTNFKYTDLRLNGNEFKPCESVHVEIELENVGNYSSEHSVLIYLQVGNRTYPVDNLRLVNFTRIEMPKNSGKVVVDLMIEPSQMTVIEPMTFDEVILPGSYQVMAGENLIYNSQRKTFDTTMKANFTIAGTTATNMNDCK